MIKSEDVFGIIKEIIKTGAFHGGDFNLPATFEREALLSDIGFDVVTLPDLIHELTRRLDGKALGLDDMLGPDEINSATLGELVDRIVSKFRVPSANPIVVYVDDEEENLFTFKRKFGKALNLRTFSDSREAAEYIERGDDVQLVITDEFMPKLTGTGLCDLVHKSKPFMKFILITGNPNQDDDLMYNALRRNRFYEFINKPMDLEKRGDEYLELIKGLLGT